MAVRELAASEESRRRELGALLRLRRERTGPEQVGLTRTGRRRTPGLRREEVAQLAGVSVTWYTWIEQGRDVNASESVLGAIARVLRLDFAEHRHMLTLAGLAEESVELEHEPIEPSLQVMLDGLDPFPAAVLNPRRDILAYNAAFGGLVEDLSAVPVEQRNAVWLIFTHRAWRRALVDWEEVAARIVAELRQAAAGHLTEPHWKALISRLEQASPEFSAFWRAGDVGCPTHKTRLLLRHRSTLLRLDYTTLWLAPRSDFRLTAYTPSDDATRAALERFARDRR